MAPVGATGASDVAAGMGDDPGAPGPGGAGAGKKGSYVPPALRDGARASAGERLGGSKFGERDDFATLRVTNVSHPGNMFPHRRPLRSVCERLLTVYIRFQRWQRRESCAICSSALAASRECSWQRTEKRAWPRVSRLSASWIGTTPSRLATKWTDMVSSISFSGWSLRRRPHSWLAHGIHQKVTSRDTMY